MKADNPETDAINEALVNVLDAYGRAGVQQDAAMFNLMTWVIINLRARYGLGMIECFALLDRSMRDAQRVLDDDEFLIATPEEIKRH